LPTLNDIAIRYLTDEIDDEELAALVHENMPPKFTDKQIKTLISTAERILEDTMDTVKGRNVVPGQIIRLTKNDVDTVVAQAGLHSTNPDRVLIVADDGFTVRVKLDQDLILVGNTSVDKNAPKPDDDDEVVDKPRLTESLKTHANAFSKPADKYDAKVMRAALVKAGVPVGARGRLSPEQKARAIELLEA
jgi:hypothetical protein